MKKTIRLLYCLSLFFLGSSFVQSQTTCVTSIGSQTTCGDGCALVNGFCVACVAGTYMTTSLLGNNEGPLCLSCLPGQYHDPGTTEAISCLNCAKHTYSNTSGLVGSCFQCYTAATAGSTTCAGCDPGTYKDSSDDLCKTCPVGYYTDDRDMRQCTDCPIGYYAKNLSTTMGEPRHDGCQECGAGRYGHATTAATMESGCKHCVQGRYSEDNLVKNENDEDPNAMCKACQAGTFNDKIGAVAISACVNCKAGTYSSTSAASNISYCLDCSAGTYSSTSAASNISYCMNCPRGRSQPRSGQAICFPCIPGTRQHETGQSFCHQCLPGHASKQEGNFNSTCTACNRGTYQPNRGRPSCIICGDGGTSNKVRTDCVKTTWKVAKDCTKYEYLDDRCYNATLHDSKNIYDQLNMGDAVCTDEEKTKYYHCATCPNGANCSHDRASLSTLRNLPGWWRIPHEFEPDNNGKGTINLYARCPFVDDCSGGELYNNNTLVTLNQCANETTSVLCSRCESGYTRIGVKCQPCAAESAAILSIVALVVAVGSVLLVVFRRTLSTDVVITARLLVAFSQISSSMPRMMLANFAFPSNYLHFLSYFSIIDFDLMAVPVIHCDVGVDFRRSMLSGVCLSAFIFTMMNVIYQIIKYRVQHAEEVYMPEAKRKVMSQLFDLGDLDLNGEICEIELLGLFKYVNDTKTKDTTISQSALHKMMKRAGAKKNIVKSKQLKITREQFIYAALQKRNGDKSGIAMYTPVLAVQHRVGLQQALSVCLSTTVQFFLLVHAPVSAKVLLYFDCHRFGKKASYLRSDYSLDCGSTDYQDYIPVVVVFLFLFVLALPLGLTCILLINRNKLYSTKIRVQIGFLYNRLVHGAEFWEVGELSRKMMFTGLLVYFPANIRPTGGLLVCIIACCFLNYSHPFKNKLVFWTAEATFVCVAVKYLVAVFGLHMGSQLNDVDMISMGTVLIVLDATVFIGIFVVVIVLLHKANAANRLRQKQMQFGCGEDEEEEYSDDDDDAENAKVKPDFTFSMRTMRKAITREKVNLIRSNSATSKSFALALIRERKIQARARVQERLQIHRQLIDSKRAKAGLPALYSNVESTSAVESAADRDSTAVKLYSNDDTAINDETGFCEVDTLFDNIHAGEEELVDSLFEGLATHESELMDDVDSLFVDLHESVHHEAQHEVDNLFANLLVTSQRS